MRKSSGFTLVELLVVVTIIGLLIALLLPAVQAAREAARTMQCGNNLKQIGLGVQLYHDANGMLPPGGHNPWRQTWYHAILPHIDQQPLYDLWDPRFDYYTSSSACKNVQIAATPVETMHCPSNRNTPFKLADTNVWFRYWRGNYVCNAGNVGVGNTGSTGLACLGSRSLAGATIRNGGAPFLVATDSGGFRYQSFGDIADGLSNTLGFSECLQGERGASCNGLTNTQDLRGSPFHAAFCWFTTWLTPNSVNPDVNPDSGGCCVPKDDAPCQSATIAGGPVALAARSRHSGGVNVSMLDGSGRFVSDSVDWNIWQALGTSAGGETPGLF